MRAPHAFFPYACLRLAACDTPEPSSHCTDLQQIPSLNKQGKLHNNKDPFSSAAYFQAIARRVLLAGHFFILNLYSVFYNRLHTHGFLFATLLNGNQNHPRDGFSDTDM